MKRVKPVRSHVLQIRVTEFEKNRIQGLAQIYAGGNTSLWIIHSALNGPRERVTNDKRNGKRPKAKRK